MISSRIGYLYAALAASAAAALAVPGAAAQDAADYFKGKTVTITVGFGSGGGYSNYCRQLVEFMGRHTAGNPTFVCSYMSGAGGVKAANYMYNAAPKDGSMIGMLADYAPVAQLVDPKKVKYDIRKFRWIGVMVPANPAMMIRKGAGIEKFEDIFDKQVVIGVVGVLGQDGINARIMQKVLGAKVKIVPGYKGTAPIALAMERGEVDSSISSWISWKTRSKTQIANGTFFPLVQVGFKRAWDLPKVPLLSEFAKDKEAKQIMNLASAAAPFGRGFTVPPDYPPHLLAALRKGFDETMKDKKFLETAKKRNIEIDPTPGAELEPILEQVMSTPKSVIAAFREAAGIK